MLYFVINCTVLCAIAPVRVLVFACSACGKSLQESFGKEHLLDFDKVGHVPYNNQMLGSLHGLITNVASCVCAMFQAMSDVTFEPVTNFLAGESASNLEPPNSNSRQAIQPSNVEFRTLVAPVQ